MSPRDIARHPEAMSLETPTPSPAHQRPANVPGAKFLCVVLGILAPGPLPPGDRDCTCNR